MINEKNFVTAFESCYFENNTAKMDLFNVQSINLLITNVTFVKNVGRIISGLDALANIKYFKLANHLCVSIGFEGCFAYLETSSLSMLNVSFEHINSLFTSDLISIKFSEVIIEDISLYSINTLSSTLLLNGKNSSVIVQNSYFDYLNKSLISLESGSNLGIFLSNFTSIYADQPDISLISCKNCDNVTLQLNNFIECVNPFSSGVVTLAFGNIS